MRMYNKEEVFLDEWDCSGVISAVNDAIKPDEWHPSYDCDDALRKNTKYFKELGQLSQLVFDSAVVHDNPFRVIVVLASSSRSIAVTLEKNGDKWVGKTGGNTEKK